MSGLFSLSRPSSPFRGGQPRLASWAWLGWGDGVRQGVVIDFASAFGRGSPRTAPLLTLPSVLVRALACGRGLGQSDRRRVRRALLAVRNPSRQEGPFRIQGAAFEGVLEMLRRRLEMFQFFLKVSQDRVVEVVVVQ